MQSNQPRPPRCRPLGFRFLCTNWILERKLHVRVWVWVCVHVCVCVYLLIFALENCINWFYDFLCGRNTTAKHGKYLTFSKCRGTRIHCLAHSPKFTPWQPGQGQAQALPLSIPCGGRIASPFKCHVKPQRSMDRVLALSWDNWSNWLKM